MPRPMTVPLWCLIAVIAWTIALVVALTIVRLRHLAAGGSPKDFGVPDDQRLMWRLFRAHQNAVENLPLFATVVLVATVRGIGGPGVDVLSVIYVLARVGQTAVHVSPTAGIPGYRRLAFLVVQLACLLGLAVMAIRSA